MFRSTSLVIAVAFAASLSSPARVAAAGQVSPTQQTPDEPSAADVPPQAAWSLVLVVQLQTAGAGTAAQAVGEFSSPDACKKAVDQIEMVAPQKLRSTTGEISSWAVGYCVPSGDVTPQAPE